MGKDDEPLGPTPPTIGKETALQDRFVYTAHPSRVVFGAGSLAALADEVTALGSGDYSSTFSCRQMAKDLDLFLDTAHADAVPAPLAAQLRETYSALIAAGEGDADFISTVPFAARLAGV